MVIFHSFLYVYQRVPRWSKMIQDDPCQFQNVHHWGADVCLGRRPAASSHAAMQPAMHMVTKCHKADAFWTFVEKISNFKASRWIGEGNRKLQVTPSLEDGFSPVGLNLRFWRCAVNVLDSWTRLRKAAVSFAHPYGNDISCLYLDSG